MMRKGGGVVDKFIDDRNGEIGLSALHRYKDPCTVTPSVLRRYTRLYWPPSMSVCGAPLVRCYGQQRSN